MSASELAITGVPGVELTPTSLKLPTDISPGNYRHVGRALGRITGMTAWAIGDWYNANPSGLLEHEITQEIVDLLGLSAATVKEYARVSAKYKPEERHGGLAWGAHQTIAAQPPEERKRILDKAERESWSVAAIRLYINGKPQLPKGKAVVVDHVAPRVRLDIEWKDEYADDADLVRTLNVELRRMVESWSYVKDVKIVAAEDEPAKP